MRLLIMCSVLLAACDEDHQLRFELALDTDGLITGGPPTCMCGFSDISLTGGAKFSFAARVDGRIEDRIVCDSLQPSAEEVTAAAIDSLDPVLRLEDLPAGVLIQFEMVFARPQADYDPCDGTNPAQLDGVPGVFLYGTSSQVSLNGDPPPILITLKCGDTACSL